VTTKVGRLLWIPAVLWAAVALGQGDDIWMAGYNPQHTAVSPYEFAPPLALLWQFSSDEAIEETARPAAGGLAGMLGMQGEMMGGMPGQPEMGGPPGMGMHGPGGMGSGTRLPKPVASPVVAGDRVFFALASNVYCVDRITGEQLWKRGVGARVWATPVYAKGYLYVAEDNGGIHALKTDRGSEEWLFRLDKGVRSALVYDDGALYAGCEDGRVYALDTSAKELKWVYSTGGRVRAAPTVWHETVFAASEDGYLYALSADGKQRWRVALGDKTCFVPPVVQSEKVYVAAGKRVLSFDARLGHGRWEFKSPALVTGALAVTQDAVYCGDAEGAVYCLDQATGSARWRYPEEATTEPMQSGVSVAQGMVLARAGTTSVLALDARTGKLVWNYKLPKGPDRPKKSTTQLTGGTLGGQMGGAMGPEGMPGAPGGGGMPGGGPAGRPGGGVGGMGTGYAVEIDMEEVVDPTAALADGRLYVLGDDCVLYGLEADAPDAVVPAIEDAIIEIQGERKLHFAYGVPIDDPDQFPLRMADSVKIPGSPPVYLSIRVTDTGCGVDPASVQLTMDGKKLDVTYDAVEGLLWYIHEAKGRGMVALPNGAHNFVMRASDWRGNRGEAQLAVTIDNSMSPPKLATPQMGGPGGGMPGMTPEMMGPGMMAPGMMAPGMMGPG